MYFCRFCRILQNFSQNSIMISIFNCLGILQHAMFLFIVDFIGDELCRNNPFYFPAKNEENDIFSSFGANYQVSVSC